jgi:leucyl-tRNA synthetase
MCPVTPHTAEELWSACGFDGLVSASEYPECDASAISGSAEYGEDLVRNVISDIGQIMKVTEMKAERLIIYTSPAWKIRLVRIAAEMSKNGKVDIPSLTKAAMSDEEIRKNGKAASDLAKKIATDMMRNAFTADTDLDEYRHLKEAEQFIASEIGVPTLVVTADSAEYDPQNKARIATPGRPAIYLE